MKISLVSKEKISEYIPQKEPMVMIDTLDHCEGASTRTSFEIRENNLFVKDGALREPGIIENIAQTAAVKAGYEAKKQGAEPLVGFIGAIKDLQIYALPTVGTVLDTEVLIKTEVMNVTIIQGTSFCAGTKIAECEMKIFIQKPE